MEGISVGGFRRNSATIQVAAGSCSLAQPQDARLARTSSGRPSSPATSSARMPSSRRRGAERFRPAAGEASSARCFSKTAVNQNVLPRPRSLSTPMSPSEQLHKLLGNRQTQARTAVLARSGAIALCETLE